MKSTIEVSSRAEGDLIRAGLENPIIRAAAQVSGALAGLDEAQKARVLKIVTEE